MHSFFVLAKKPVGISSSSFSIKFKKYFFEKFKNQENFDVKWRNYKFGHAGTLDPQASGMMLLASSRATKFLPYLLQTKEYEFEIWFGKKTDTSDLEGDIIQEDLSFSLENITKIKLQEVLNKFAGTIKQIPTKFSAIKINGKRAYELARSNEEFIMPEREVEIYSLSIVSINEQDNKLTLKVKSSSGLYVRTLAEDIAKFLNTYGTVSKLKRICTNNFHEFDFNLDYFQLNKEIIENHYKIINLNYFCSIYKTIMLYDHEISRLLNGANVYIENLKNIFSSNDFKISENDILSIVDKENNKFYGLGRLQSNQEKLFCENIEKSCNIFNKGAVLFALCMIKN